MKPVVVVQGLAKRFSGRMVLVGVDLELPEGTTTVLLGANGAGKSTLLRILLGLERPDRGQVRVTGFDPVREARAVRERVGYVPAELDAYDWMTPRELYRFFAPQYRRWSPEIERRLVERLEVRVDTRLGFLSRGEAAKALFVAALAPQPDLYLLDETFAGLDPIVRDEVLAAFLAEVELERRAALVVTHELDIAARVADRVAVLDQGRIAACADLEDVTAAAEARSLPSALKEHMSAIASARSTAS